MTTPTGETAGAGMEQQWTVEDDTEATIKPCPKCGGKAILEGTYYDQIVCNGCGLWSGEDMEDLNEAIEWWNTQPLVERLTAQHEQLQQRVQELEAQVRHMTDVLAEYERQEFDV